MQLVEINPSNVQKVFPAFFHEQAQFFMLEHQGKEVGIYGIKTIDTNTCEISVCIFEEYRYKIPYKTTTKLLLEYPFSLGFDKITLSTKEKSIETLLRSCKRLGVKVLAIIKDKVWFVKELSKEGATQVESEIVT